MAAADPVDGPAHGTERPICVAMDYDPRHVNDPEFFRLLEASPAGLAMSVDVDSFNDTVRRGPPDLLIVGKDVAFTHNWGPIRRLGGENQFTGGKHNSEFAIRLTPDEVRERIDHVKKFTGRMHAYGVGAVVPYVGMGCLAGDGEKRTGFWDFYDRWDDYREWLGPRPETDPAEWVQRDADGNPHWAIEHYRNAPYYLPGRRWSVCVQNPAWRSWMKTVIRLIAACGYDGVFVDNVTHLKCLCAHCQARFAEYLEARYSPEEAARLFRGARTYVEMSNPAAPPLASYEVQRFRLQSTAEFLAELADEGKQSGSSFLTIGNLSSLSAWESVGRALDYAWLECGYFDCREYYWGGNTGMFVATHFPEKGRQYNTSIFPAKYAQGSDAGCRPLFQTSHFIRHWWYDKAAETNRLSVALAYAELGAFGSGASCERNGHLLGTQEFETFGRFFREHADLYEGYESWARIGLAVFAEQRLYGDDRHLTSAFEIADRLFAYHVPFDILTERTFRRKDLRGYDRVILPGIQYLSHDVLDATRRYAQSGGVVLATGSCAEFDERGQERDVETRARLFARPSGDEKKATTPVGAGRIVFYPEGLDHDQADLRRELAERYGDDLLVTFEGRATEALRTNWFVKYPAPDRFQAVLHVLNYNVPLGGDRTQRPEPMPATDVAVTAVLPREWRVETVTCFEPPGDETQDAGFRHEAGKLRIELRDIAVAKLCVLKGRLHRT